MTEDELGQEAEALEDQAAADVDDGLGAATAVLIVAFTALWLVHPVVELRAKLLGLLADLPGPADPTRILPTLTAATALGARVVKRDPPPVPVPSDVRAEAAAIPGRVRAHLDHARVLASTVDDYDDVVRVAAVARQAGRSAPLTARNLVNRSIATGTTFVCDQLNLSRQWRAETNACLHCQPYDRRIARPGQPFPAGLTYAKKPLDLRPVLNPPRHPNCRCRVWPRFTRRTRRGTQ